MKACCKSSGTKSDALKRGEKVAVPNRMLGCCVAKGAVPNRMLSSQKYRGLAFATQKYRYQIGCFDVVCKKKGSKAHAFKLRCQNSGTKSDTGLGESEVVGETSGWLRYGQ